MRLKIKYILAVILILLTIKYSIIFNGEIIETYYPSINEVIKDKAQERGWIPSFLPESSYDINEQHNLDTNAQIVEFSFLLKDRDKLLDIEKKAVGIYSVNNLPAGWKLIQNNIELYCINDSYKKSYLAINWKQNRALYWSQYK